MMLSKIQKIIDSKKGSFKTRGWVKRKRDLAGKLFILLRDETDELQCVLDREKADKKIVALAESLFIESSVILEGTLKKDDRAPHGVEMQIEKLEAVYVGEKFPIQRDLSTEFLQDVRHLWVRSAKIKNALIVRETIFKGFREFMDTINAVESQGPMFVTGAVEGGSTLFETPYFGKKAYLTQSSQFYMEVLMFSLGNVYTIAPSFRAEKSHTKRHLTEFWHAEGEFPWMHLDELIDLEEKMLQFIVKKCVEENSKELKLLGREPSELEPSITGKYKRFTYEEILKKAQKKFPSLKYGQDLGEKEERELTKDEDKPMIVTHYPKTLKPFYHRPNPNDTKTVLCNDILAPEGYGEIIGSGERCWTEQEIMTRLKEANIDPAPYQWYIDLRKYGAVPHSGFGLGIDRLTAWITKAEHIRDVIPFPRTINRLYP